MSLQQIDAEKEVSLPRIHTERGTSFPPGSCRKRAEHHKLNKREMSFPQIHAERGMSLQQIQADREVSFP